MSYGFIGKRIMTLQVTLDDDNPKENRGADITDMTEDEFAQVVEYCKRVGKITLVSSRNAIYVGGDLLTLAEITVKLQEMDASEDVADQRATYNE
jgi:hypothetical protein